MRYLGGKTAIARRLAAVLEKHRPQNSRFIDVFCGGLSVVSEMGGRRVANDACIPLITTYRHYQDGWRPPDTALTEYEFGVMKHGPRNPNDPMTAFVGFGLTYVGKWYSGFARSSPGLTDDPTFYYSAKRLLAQRMRLCKGVEFTSLDYSKVQVQCGDLVYCDPPYQTGVRNKWYTRYTYFTEPFDHDAYHRCIRTWAHLGAIVLVSDYERPPHTFEVAQWTLQKSPLSGTQTERLFIVG